MLIDATGPHNGKNTAANWCSNNPVLPAGNVGYETDTGRFKFGDGSTPYNGLPYFQKELKGSLGIRGLQEPIPIKTLLRGELEEPWDGTSVDDATKSHGGTQSIRLDSASKSWAHTGWVGMQWTTSADGGVPITGCIGLWLYTDCAIGDCWDMMFDIIPENGDGNNYFQYKIVDSKTHKYIYRVNNWFLVMLNPYKFSKVGTVDDWSADQVCKQIRVQFRNENATTYHLWIGGVFCENFPKAAITIGWDGIDVNWKPDLVDAYGWPGNMFVLCNSTYLGSQGVTPDDLRVYYNKGWDVIPHTWSLCGEGASEADIRSGCNKMMRFMSVNGFHTGTFLGSSCGTGIYCTDAAEARDIIADYKIASRGKWGSPTFFDFETNDLPQDPFMNEIPAWIWPDYYNIHDMSVNDTNWEDCIAKITEAVALKGVYHFHTHGNQGGGGINISQANFEAILSHIDSFVKQRKLEVITFTDYLNRTLLRPGFARLNTEGEIFINANKGRVLY